MPVNAQEFAVFPVWSSNAAWTHFNKDGTPQLAQFRTKRETFYTLKQNECGSNTAGGCSDATRYVMWPDSPFMVTRHSAENVLGYTWIKDACITYSMKSFIANPDTSLYRVTWEKRRDGNCLPRVDIISEAFWKEKQIPLGVYGTVVKDTVACLFGQFSKGIHLARVAANHVTDIKAYECWVNRVWTKRMPSSNTKGAVMTINIAGGQGTFYYSDHWKSYVWIGQAHISVSADFTSLRLPNPKVH